MCVVTREAEALCDSLNAHRVTMLDGRWVILMHHTLFLIFVYDALNTVRVTVFDARDASMLVMHHTVC